VRALSVNELNGRGSYSTQKANWRAMKRGCARISKG
jgi:hypothetical protein